MAQIQGGGGCSFRREDRQQPVGTVVSVGEVQAESTLLGLGGPKLGA